MKKIWSAPVAIAEQFAANEYVAACGDENRVYKFECTAARGTAYYYGTGDGIVDGNYTGTGSATSLGGYKPCKAKHEAPTTGDFYDGFVDRNDNGRCDSGEEAIIWVEYIPTIFGMFENPHATENLNMDSWETAKS